MKKETNQYNKHEVNSLEHFQRYSRLHFIGQFKTRVDDLFKQWFIEHPSWNHGELHQQCLFIHVDMDAFFCSVQLAKPEHAHLRSLPVAIAAGRNNSDISSCNYVARKFGIHAGMYVNKAMQRCPALVTLGYDMPSCERVAHILYRILFELFPVEKAHMSLEVYSVDEVMIAVDTDDIPLIIKYCESVRNELEQTTQCTASCGIAPNIMLARLATQEAKPNGIHVIHRNEIASVMQTLPFNAIHGVGEHVFAKVRDLLIKRKLLSAVRQKEPKQRLISTEEQEKQEQEEEEEEEEEEEWEKEENVHTNNKIINKENDEDEESDDDEEIDSSITCGVVQALSKAEMQLLLGKKNGETIYYMCRGVDKRVVTRTGDAINKRTMGKPTPNSLGCTMNYAVRPSCVADIYKIAEDLIRDVCSKVARAKVTVNGLRVTILERHPLHPRQTPKYMGRGFCLELHLPIKLRHALDEHDADAMLAEVKTILAPLLVVSRPESDLERAKELHLINADDDNENQENGSYTGWTLPVTSLRDIVIEDVRGMTIQATGLRLKAEEAFPELEKPAHKVIHDQMTLATAFARAAMTNERTIESINHTSRELQSEHRKPNKAPMPKHSDHFHHSNSNDNNDNNNNNKNYSLSEVLESYSTSKNESLFAKKENKRKRSRLEEPNWPKLEMEEGQEQKIEEIRKEQETEKKEDSVREESKAVEWNDDNENSTVIDENKVPCSISMEEREKAKDDVQLWTLWRLPLSRSFCTLWDEQVNHALNCNDVPRIKSYVRCALYKLSFADNNVNDVEINTLLVDMLNMLMSHVSEKLGRELL